MTEILELLNNADFINDYKIEEYKEFGEGFYIRILANLKKQKQIIYQGIFR